jgi:hypothetical protein
MFDHPMRRRLGLALATILTTTPAAFAQDQASTPTNPAQSSQSSSVVPGAA